MDKEIIGTVRCRKCGKPIAYIYKIDTGHGFIYKEENAEARYVDRWGFVRNFCKGCMR